MVSPKRGGGLTNLAARDTMEVCGYGARSWEAKVVALANPDTLRRKCAHDGADLSALRGSV